MTRVWTRTHDDGTVALVMRFLDQGETVYKVQFHPPSQIGGAVRHRTERGAQQEADWTVAANGHSCTDNCSRWTPVSSTNNRESAQV